MLRELSILAIFITANIVTWQERFIHFLAKQYASKHILDILTKIHLVQFTTFQQPEHKRQILGWEVTFCLKPIASSHSDMSETSPYGYIVHVDSTVRKELLTSRTLRVSPSICSAWSAHILQLVSLYYYKLLRTRIFARIRCFSASGKFGSEICFCASSSILETRFLISIVFRLRDLASVNHFKQSIHPFIS